MWLRQQRRPHSGVVVWSCAHCYSACFDSSGLQTIMENVTRLATEKTQIVVHAMPSLFLSKPTIFPVLRCKSRDWLWSTGWSSRGGSIPRGIRVRQIFVTGVLIGCSSWGLALVIELVLCLVC